MCVRVHNMYCYLVSFGCHFHLLMDSEQQRNAADATEHLDVFSVDLLGSSTTITSQGQAQPEPDSIAGI